MLIPFFLAKYTYFIFKRWMDGGMEGPMDGRTDDWTDDVGWRLDVRGCVCVSMLGMGGVGQGWNGWSDD